MSMAMYGVAIHQAIAAGDRTKMQEVARQAQAYLAQHGDLAAAIEILKSELAKRGESNFTSSMLLYGVVIHQAIESGDAERMQAVAKQAEEHLAGYGDVGAALTTLKAAIAQQ